jgi:hypothetical protein
VHYLLAGVRIYVDGWRQFRPVGRGESAGSNIRDNLKFLQQMGSAGGQGRVLKTRAAENVAELKRYMASSDAGLCHLFRPATL